MGKSTPMERLRYKVAKIGFGVSLPDPFLRSIGRSDDSEN